MADVHVLPGIERHDIGNEVEPAHVLECAEEMNLQTVIVIGYGRDGWYLATSSPDMDKNAGMLARASYDILRCEGAEKFRTEEN